MVAPTTRFVALPGGYKLLNDVAALLGAVQGFLDGLDHLAGRLGTQLSRPLWQLGPSASFTKSRFGRVLVGRVVRVVVGDVDLVHLEPARGALAATR